VSAPPTDVDISRALNALSMTLRDQRPERFDAARVEQIALGALAHEPKLSATATGETSGELRTREEGRLVATIALQHGQWTVERKLRAGESSWALPQPAHDEQQQSQGA
jgi:nitrogen fixation protein FixH